MREIIVDNFAGGGGASTGIEIATGRSVDVAINHDPAAIAMHRANHPATKHYCESVWDVDPIEACEGHPVALAWFSPDCKHFSKAKGGKPCEKKIRGLAWIVLKWAAMVRPRVIMLENVEEFQTWGPLNRNHYPIKSKKGNTYWKWRGQLESMGYEVETKELIACDYGAPTKRKRFFMIARCDGNPIVWPEPTHGPRNSQDVINGLLKPYVPAAEIIDWSIPCKSIFGRSKPLAENTMKRIARGLQKFVIDNPEPFIVQVNHGGDGFRGQGLDEPMPTITGKHGFGVVTPYITAIGQTGFSVDRSKSLNDPLTTIVSKQEHCLITPTLIQYHTERSPGEVRGQSVDNPLYTLDTNPRYGLVSAFISKNYAGESRSIASGVDDCIHTITARQCHSLVEVQIDKDKRPSDEVREFFEKYYGKAVFGDSKRNDSKDGVVTSHIIQMNNNMVGSSMDEPVNTIVAGPGHIGEVRAFLTKYYGQGVGQAMDDPLDTVVSKDRFGLVLIKGVEYQIVDIGLRMLEPHELFAAQGFPDDYIIDRDYKGNSYPKTAQVARCGNAVPPPFATALVKANLPDQCTDAGLPKLKIDSSQQQLRFA